MKVKYLGEEAIRHKGYDFYPGKITEVANDLVFEDPSFEIESEEKSPEKKTKKSSKKGKQ